MLPPNIRVVIMNCQPTWVTQNAIPEEQELISLGGGHYDPPPDKVGLKDLGFHFSKFRISPYRSGRPRNTLRGNNWSRN